MDDMLFTLHRNGIEGKLWRLVKSLNEGLCAKVNTKAGPTRAIKRETGGKQGGKLMVCLFAKMMDNLAEDMLDNPELGINVAGTTIPSLLFVDDATTFAEGYEQQDETLNEMHEFAVKHKIEWGQEKCQTMEIGAHKEKKQEWQLGDKKITKCDEYRYLGETITRDGKNDKNLKVRVQKLSSCVRAILTCCKSEIMKRIGIKVILKLYETEAVTAFLYNSETWTINKTEKSIVDKAEIQAFKKMIGLPKTTPTAGIMLTLGCLFASVRIETKQLMYLHRILNKESGNWAKSILFHLKNENIGWAKQLNELLERYGLEQEWTHIAATPAAVWKASVKNAAEKENIRRLKEECETKRRGETKTKTKTKFVDETLQGQNHQRVIDPFLNQYQSIIHARSLIMGRYGMLQCAQNFSNGYGSKLCSKCKVVDDESHRINWCDRWRSINLCDSETKLNYSDIFSDDIKKCMKVVETIISIWDLENGKNEMRQ